MIIPIMISSSLAAFISGRYILFIVPVLVHNYHRATVPPRAAMKIDIVKAFDVVSWQLILDILGAFNLPCKFGHWVEACITSPKFSIPIDGALEGFSPGH